MKDFYSRTGGCPIPFWEQLIYVTVFCILFTLLYTCQRTDNKIGLATQPTVIKDTLPIDTWKECFSVYDDIDIAVEARRYKDGRDTLIVYDSLRAIKQLMLQLKKCQYDQSKPVINPYLKEARWQNQ